MKNRNFIIISSSIDQCLESCPFFQTKNFGKSATEVNQEDQMLTNLLANGKTSDAPVRKKKGGFGIRRIFCLYEILDY